MIKIYDEKQNIQIIVSKHCLASNLQLDKAISYLLTNINCVLLRQSLWEVEDEEELREKLGHDKLQRKHRLKFSEVASLFYKPL